MKSTTIARYAHPFFHVGLFTLVVFILWAGKAVIVPIAMAVFITFLLSPVTRYLENRGLKRVWASMLTIVGALLLTTVFGWVLSLQVTDLARTLPKHREQIKKKVSDLRQSGGGIVSSFMELIEDVSKEEKRTSHSETVITETGTSIIQGPPKPAEKEPVMIVKQEEPSVLVKLSSAATVIEPVAHSAIVLIFVIFMLIGAQDLRDRFLGSLGKGSLVGTTRVLSEAATKVSRLLFFQLLVNAAFGLMFAVGLYFIGVQYAILWGFLTTIMRFIPYIGTWMALLFPFSLSFATSDTWNQPLMVLGYFAIIDVLVANALEPLLFGRNTGVSPLALLISAVFWSWLWGAIGLLLSTPITVCLAVIGQHIPQLRTLALLLGNGPPLLPHLQYYQRLVGKDKNSAAKLLQEKATPETYLETYDGLVLPALALTARDKASGELSAAEEQRVYQLTSEIIEESQKVKAIEQEEGEATTTTLPQYKIVGISAHRSVEQLPFLMMKRECTEKGMDLIAVPAAYIPAQIEQVIRQTAPQAIIISLLPPGGFAQTKYLCKRLQKQNPDVPIVIFCWNNVKSYDQLLFHMKKAGATYLTTNLAQTLSQLEAMKQVTSIIQKESA